MKKIHSVFILATFVAFFAACAYAKTACNVISTADDVCHILTVPTPDGGTAQVHVSGAELRAIGKAKLARDGGVQ